MLSTPGLTGFKCEIPIESATEETLGPFAIYNSSLTSLLYAKTSREVTLPFLKGGIMCLYLNGMDESGCEWKIGWGRPVSFFFLSVVTASGCVGQC